MYTFIGGWATTGTGAGEAVPGGGARNVPLCGGAGTAVDGLAYVPGGGPGRNMVTLGDAADGWDGVAAVKYEGAYRGTAPPTPDEGGGVTDCCPVTGSTAT